MSTSKNRGTLANRLASHLAATAACAAGALAVAGTASADINYHVYNTVIPANIDGIYLNVETFQVGTTGSTVPGWDLNPYSSTSLTWFNATGTGMLRYPGVTTGSAGNLAADTPIGSTGSYGSGTVTVGSAAGNWQLNAVNLFGFRFLASDGQTHYGWGRIQVGSSITVRTLIDVAWETTAGTVILAGSQGGGPPPYDPCAPFNPSISIGVNSLPMNQATAATLNLTGSCGLTIYKANYFKFVAPAAGEYTFSTCASGQDTRMAILDGCAAGSGVLACNDDACGLSSSITLNLSAGSTCYCVIGATSPTATLPNAIATTLAGPPVPACVKAMDAAFGDNAFDNTASTSAQSVRSDAAGTASATINKVVWYAFTPSVTGAYRINTCGTNGDTMLAIGTECPAIQARFECIAFNDDAPCPGTTVGSRSFLDVTNNGATGTFAGFPLAQDLVAGTTYYICAGSYGASTAITGVLSIDGPPQSVPGDINGDGVVDAADLATLLGAWDTSDPMADINHDGLVDAADLSILLGNWTM